MFRVLAAILLTYYGVIAFAFFFVMFKVLGG